MAKTKAELISYLLDTNNFKATDTELKDTIQSLAINPTYPIILVGGTNGKGSTCAYLTTILTNSGYNVGTFTSPHIFDYNERIAINNKPIDDQNLCDVLAKIIANSSVNLGLFKSFLLAAHLLFIQKKIDVAIVEVGVGGGHDATNLFEPDLSIISSVALDHCEILGNNIDEIGLEKAKIFRTNKPAIVGMENPPQPIIDYAQQINAQLSVHGRDFSFIRHQYGWDFISNQANYYSLPYPSLRGDEQLYNASLAIMTLVKLQDKFPVNIAQIKAGLLQTNLLGRFQVLPGTPQIILDTAHNPQAIEIMCNNMLKLPFAKRNFAIFAVAKDKDWQTIIKLACGKFDYWYLAWLNSERSVNPDLIAQELTANGITTDKIIINNKIENAFSQCYQQLTNEDRIVAFGSFLLVEEVSYAIQKVRK